MKTQKYIVGLGAAVMDYLQKVEKFPTANSKIRSTLADLQAGGSAMTALVMLAHLGCQTRALTVVGQDALGKLLVADLKKHHVETKFVQTIEGKHSSLSSVIIAKNTRTIVGHYELEDKLNLQHIKKSFWSDVRLLHIDGHHAKAALRAAKKVKVCGGIVSLDAGHASPDIQSLLPYADIMIFSESFVLENAQARNIGDHMKELAKKFHPEILIITRGEKGVCYWKNNQVKKMPAFKIQTTDTTGAGDVFHGAFLYGYLHGWSQERAIQFAQAASALKVQHLGARHGLPSKLAINRFLKRK